MNSRIYVSSLLAAALVGTATLSIGWAAQPEHQGIQSDKQSVKGQPAMPADCASMMKMREEMMGRQKEATARLDHLLATMNDASGTAKMDAMAATINELVKQRADAHKSMMNMEPAMKRHMMQHMMDAAPADMREKMKKCTDECPMMGGPSGKGY
jgi:soluble cytochrome b562